jgi:AmmeMemoRadiSam system protein A
MNFTLLEKESMLALAGGAIAAELNVKNLPSSTPGCITESLRTRCGAFVSVYVKDKLRGCIGTFSEDDPLYRNIERMAVSASTSDSRFSPILPGELEYLRIEISVLTPRIPVKDPSEIEIGKHGIFMIQGSHRGTFLPQVAVQQQWTVEEFLGHCARNKAGIGWEGWKDAELFSYEAIVFSTGGDDA